MNKMIYKGYAARIEYDDEDKIFVGHLAGIRDVVSFHGDSVTSLEKAFHEATDDYLQACEMLGQRPSKSASGKLLLRIQPEVHARAAMTAQAAGMSLNAWAAEVIAQHA